MSVNCANDTADRKYVPKEERCDGITSNENITTSTSPLLLPSIVVVVFSGATAAAGAGGRCYIVQLARARLHSSLLHRLAHQPNSSTAQHGGRRAMLLPQ